MIGLLKSIGIAGILVGFIYASSETLRYLDRVSPQFVTWLIGIFAFLTFSVFIWELLYGYDFFNGEH